MPLAPMNETEAKIDALEPKKEVSQISSWVLNHARELENVIVRTAAAYDDLPAAEKESQSGQLLKQRMEVWRDSMNTLDETASDIVAPALFI